MRIIGLALATSMAFGLTAHAFVQVANWIRNPLIDVEVREALLRFTAGVLLILVIAVAIREYT